MSKRERENYNIIAKKKYVQLFYLASFKQQKKINEKFTQYHRMTVGFLSQIVFASPLVLLLSV